MDEWKLREFEYELHDSLWSWYIGDYAYAEALLLDLIKRYLNEEKNCVKRKTKKHPISKVEEVE